MEVDDEDATGNEKQIQEDLNVTVASSSDSADSSVPVVENLIGSDSDAVHVEPDDDRTGSTSNDDSLAAGVKTTAAVSSINSVKNTTQAAQNEEVDAVQIERAMTTTGNTQNVSESDENTAQREVTPASEMNAAAAAASVSVEDDVTRTETGNERKDRVDTTGHDEPSIVSLAAGKEMGKVRRGEGDVSQEQDTLKKIKNPEQETSECGGSETRDESSMAKVEELTAVQSCPLDVNNQWSAYASVAIRIVILIIMLLAIVLGSICVITFLSKITSRLSSETNQHVASQLEGGAEDNIIGGGEKSVVVKNIEFGETSESSVESTCSNEDEECHKGHTIVFEKNSELWVNNEDYWTNWGVFYREV